jgi:polygalacturonase
MDPAAHADAVQALGPSRHTVFDGNRVSGGRGFLLMFAPADIGMRAGQLGVMVKNNVFTGRDFGVRVFSSPGIRIVHNKVWGSQTGPGTGIDFEDPMGDNLPTTHAVLRNNVVKRLDVSPSTTYRSEHNVIALGPR